MEWIKMSALEEMYEKILQKNGKLVISPECVGYKSTQSLEKKEFKKISHIKYNPYSIKVRNNGKKSD